MKQDKEFGELILFIIAICGFVMAMVIGCLSVYGALTEEKPSIYLNGE